MRNRRPDDRQSESSDVYLVRPIEIAQIRAIGDFDHKPS
jgi:hypothetical protein